MLQLRQQQRNLFPVIGPLLVFLPEQRFHRGLILHRGDQQRAVKVPGEAEREMHLTDGGRAEGQHSDGSKENPEVEPERPTDRADGGRGWRRQRRAADGRFSAGTTLSYLQKQEVPWRSRRTATRQRHDSTLEGFSFKSCGKLA